MSITYMPPIDHHGAFSKKRMQLQPLLPIPINYASAAIPTFAPYGTEYTPDHTMKIIGGRRISIPNSIAHIPKYPDESLRKNADPDIAPTKAIQNVHALDGAQWAHQSKSRFDTTYRTEYINRIRHPEYIPWYQQKSLDQYAKPTQTSKSSLNQYSVLPPINPKSATTNNRYEASARRNKTDVRQPIKDQEVPSNETLSKDIPPLNLNNGTQQNYNQQQQQQPMMTNEDTYLPEEPVLLTDYEEERLSEQIRNQLGNPLAVDRLKLFYQEIAAYDPNVTGYVHYTNIQLVADQLGLNLQEDTLRFAMCKFVATDRGRGFVSYEDMVRYFGKCLSSINPNQYGPSQPYNSAVYRYPNMQAYHQNECRCRHQHNPYFNHPCPIHHYHP